MEQNRLNQQDLESKFPKTFEFSWIHNEMNCFLILIEQRHAKMMYLDCIFESQ